MRRSFIFTSFFLFFLVTGSYAQLSISTDERIDAYWSDTDDEWVILSEKENATLFEFNADFSMFTHTTTTIKSTYYVKSKPSYNEARERYEMEVVSDVGNKYTMIIDIADSNLRFIYDREGTTYAVRHHIKSSWTAD